MKKRVRIIDIAKKARVSRGTVDRVIHNRGNVSPHIKERILAVMKELNYERNLIASTLAYNRVFNIGVLLPNFADDPFWEQPKIGIDKAMKTVEHYGLQLSSFYFNQYDTRTFEEQGRKLLAASPDAVLLAPVFDREARKFMQACEEQEIPYIQINTNLQREGRFNRGYIGQDSYQSGVLAARLLGLQVHEPGKQCLILHLEKDVKRARHLAEKEQGFRDYFHNHPSLQIDVVGQSFSPAQGTDTLQAFMKQNLPPLEQLAGVFVSTSRAYLVADYFFSVAHRPISLVGFDLIPANIKLLEKGKVDFLINQNPSKQGYYALMQLVSLLLEQKGQQETINVPLDVVLKENLSYYQKATQDLRLLV